MQFQISREALLKPLQLVSGVVERRQTLPVLANVLLVLKDDQLSLTGTDLEVELVGRTSVDQALQSGEITVPARKFLDICSFSSSVYPGTLIISILSWSAQGIVCSTFAVVINITFERS